MSRFYRHILIPLLMVCTLLWPCRAAAQVNTDQVVRVGQNAMYFEDYVLAIQYFNQAIQAKPYLAQPYLLRAIAKFNLEDWSGAEADAAKAIEINPYLPDAWEVRGVARQNNGNSAGAVTDYDNALQLLPRNRQIMFNRALALSDMREYQRADSAFNQILEYYPNFDNGYLGRAKLMLQMGDTIAATADIDHALQINPNTVNGYILRADIAINCDKADKDEEQIRDDYSRALSDMDNAIKLEPRVSGLYINRAFLRHALDDYFGAMADYDYALQLDPHNMVATFNRGILRMEVSDNDLALVDFNAVLNHDPDDYRALYNRAVIEGYKGDYTAAINDLDRVIDKFPDFAGAYYMRSTYHEAKNNIKAAKRDYDMAMALTAPDRAEQLIKEARDENKTSKHDTQDVPPELIARRFDNLLTIDNDTHIDEEYNNSSIRGRVQNHDIQIEIEPFMVLSYYAPVNEIQNNTYYIKEVDNINTSHTLRYSLVVTPRPPQLYDEDIIKGHFSSIDYYNSYLSSHTPRAIDYFGRAMDFVTLKNYPEAIYDLNRALECADDFMLAHLLRAQARYLSHDQTTDLKIVLADLDQAIAIDPRNAVVWYDKGNVLFDMGDMTSAIACYSQAIALQPDMGEAYYNRGYIYLKLGNQTAGVADLSKAGELGIAAAYNLLKRITKL